MRYREIALLLVLPFYLFPRDEAINGHGDVIEFHATICIKAMLIVEDNIQNLHDKAHQPQPDAGLVLQEDIGQPQQCGGDVKPMG